MIAENRTTRGSPALLRLGPKATVERALRRFRYLAWRHVWGGMHDDHELATEALEALDRLVEVKQLELGGSQLLPAKAGSLSANSAAVGDAVGE